MHTCQKKKKFRQRKNCDRLQDNVLLDHPGVHCCITFAILKISTLTYVSFFLRVSIFFVYSEAI